MRVREQVAWSLLNICINRPVLDDVWAWMLEAAWDMSR